MYVLIADVEKILNAYKPGPFRQLGNGFGRLMGGSHHLGDHSLVKNLHELIYGTSFYERNRMYFQQKRFTEMERIRGSLIEDLLAQYPTKEGAQSRVVADSLRYLIEPLEGPLILCDFYKELILDYIGRNLDDEGKDKLRFDIPVLDLNRLFRMREECNALARFYWGLSNQSLEDQELAKTRLVQLFNEQVDQQEVIKQVILAVLARVLDKQSCDVLPKRMPELALFLVSYMGYDMGYAGREFKRLKLFQFFEIDLPPADVLASVLGKSWVQELHFCCDLIHDIPADFWALLNRALEDSWVSMIRVDFRWPNFLAMRQPIPNSQSFCAVWARTTMQFTVSDLPLGWSADKTERFFDSLAQSQVKTLIFEKYGPEVFLRQDQVRALARVLPRAKFTTLKFILDIASPLFLKMLEDWRALFQILPCSQVTALAVAIVGLDVAGGTTENRAALAVLLAELQVHKLKLTFQRHALYGSEFFINLPAVEWIAVEDIISKLNVKNFELDNYVNIQNVDWGIFNRMYRPSQIKGLGFRDIDQFDKVSDIQWQDFLAIFEDSKITSVQIRLQNPARRAQLKKLIEQNVRRSFVDMKSGSLQHTIAHRLWQRPGAAITSNPEAGTRTFTARNLRFTFAQTGHAILSGAEAEYAACGVRYSAS